MYDDMPKEMRSYLRHNGWNFNKKACEYAVGLMSRKDKQTGKKESIKLKTKEEVEGFLNSYCVTLEHAVGYNHVYVYHMGRADYMGSSIADEHHLAKYVKDVIDDDDNPGGNVMRKWYADMVYKGIPVEWSELL